MKIIRFLVVASACVLMVLVASHSANAIECIRAPLPPALDALASDSAVAFSTVTVDSWDGATPAPVDDNIYYAFTPKKTAPTVGFIILPGGNCDPRSYAPAAHAIAAKGFFTCIIPVPNCVATNGYLRADKIISDYGEVKKWAIGGHSIGGTAAGFYALQSNIISGVVIWASFMDEAHRLDQTTLKVLSVTGSLDGRATPEQVKENAKYLPADTVFVEIEGGNHTQFGWIDPSPYPYPYLELDNPATITIEDQQKQIVQATTCFLNQFNPPASSHPPMPEALEAMESGGSVTVETIEVTEWAEGSNFYYVFKPKYVKPKIGFIFYPGGLVDPRAYAPPAREIAAHGYLVVIVKMVRDLAVFSSDRADKIISDYSEIKTWIIGGHSIGGSFSCSYAKNHTDKIAGVALWAAWPSEDFRLDDTDLKAISIFGTNDGAPDEIKAGAEHLPEGTPFVEIEGGNHTQFGYYWDGVNEDFVQPCDNPADISREKQQRQIIKATLDFLDQFKENMCPATFLLGTGDTRLGTLRQFRDTVLAKSFAGEKLIDLYYSNGKRITTFFDHSPSIKYSAKKILELSIPMVQRLMAF
jgi:pimeloyl-ACP methyl ester carboxylesterase